MTAPASAASLPPALATRALYKRFGSLAVTQNVEITLPQGARYALIGPNGAGKTTLINLVTGQLAPDQGSMLLNGEDITALGPDARVKRGLTRTGLAALAAPEGAQFDGDIADVLFATTLFIMLAALASFESLYSNTRASTRVALVRRRPAPSTTDEPEHTPTTTETPGVPRLHAAATTSGASA